MSTHTGLLLLDKPIGPTSHDLVYALRRGTGEKRVGHAGTLDPLATGLLVMCLGNATRLSEYLTGKDKRYRATVRLGQTTDTYDAEGRIIAESTHVPALTDFTAALPAFRGPIQQVPPQFSAIKRGGQKAYEVARRGETLELEPRPVTILALELVEWAWPLVVLEVHCSAGTYIRSLAHDLGLALGCGAHLAALRRTASGSLRVEEAVSLAELQTAFAAGEWEKYLRPAQSAFGDWPQLTLTPVEAERIQRGQSIRTTAPLNADLALALHPAGHLLAVLQADVAGQVWRPQKVLA